MKRRILFGALLAAGTVAAVLLAARPARRGAEEWERVKAEMKAWYADHEADTERMRRGEVLSPERIQEMKERVRELNVRYEKVRKW